MEVSWSDVKSLVKPINNQLFKIIEDINPPSSLTLDLVKYSYGETISDEKYFFTQDSNEEICIKPNTDFPLTLILENKCELFLETSSNIIPWLILKPGDIFPLIRETTTQSDNYQFHPGSVLKLVAGLRNVTLLPLYSYSDAYRKIHKYYKLQTELNPARYMDHYKIFNTIAKKENSSWKTSILYFSDKWREKIANDPKWYLFKQYLIERSYKINDCKRNMIYLNYAMRDIAISKKFSHKYYTEDIIKQLLFISVGEFPGYIPSTDELGIPSKVITESLVNISNAINTPIIMEPCLFTSRHSDNSVYLSITQNTMSIAEKKTFKPTNYLAEIDMYFSLYLENFKFNKLTKDTIYGEIADLVKLKLYSEKGNSNNHILKAKSIIEHDDRVKKIFDRYSSCIKYGLPERSPFLKAFINISTS